MRSIIITLTSNLSVEVSSCLNSLSLNPVKTKILKFSGTLIMSSWKNLPCYGVVNLTYPIFFCFIWAISEFNAHFQNEAKSGAPGWMQNFSCENEFYLHEYKNALSDQWLCTFTHLETEAWCNSEMAYYGLLHWVVLPWGSLIRWRAEKLTADVFLRFFFCFW